jgi:hypothetical protein
VPHVEFSVSEPSLTPARPPAAAALDRWARAVGDAEEPSLVIDARQVIIATSLAFESLVGLRRPATGQGLLDGVLQLLDFANGAPLSDAEIGKIPPLLALSSGRLARGLLRLSCGETACTLDAIATPLFAGGVTVGSLTFFSRV